MHTERLGPNTNSYGLVFIQPEGIRVGLDKAFQELFSKEISLQNFINGDLPVPLQQMFQRYPLPELTRFISDLSQSNIILTLERGLAHDRVWDINYAGFSQSIYYDILRNSLKGNCLSYLIESPIPDQEMEWFLKNLKGDKRIISADAQGNTVEVRQPGKGRARGLRSLVTNRAYNTDLFKELPHELQKEIVVRFMHTSDNLSIILSSLHILLNPPLSPTELQSINLSGLSIKDKIRTLAEKVHKKYALDC